MQYLLSDLAVLPDTKPQLDMETPVEALLGVLAETISSKLEARDNDPTASGIK